MFLIGGSIVTVLILLVALATVSQRADYSELISTVATLDITQAEFQHNEALNTAARRFETTPALSISHKEFDYYVMLSVLTKDRIHELKGLPNGPSVRKKWRKEIVANIKKIAGETNRERVQ